MVPKLYKFDPSPPARACMMACDMFEVPVQMVDLDITSRQNRTAEYLKLNPLHTVPVFEDGDLVIHDSHAILMYLSDTYGNNDSLYPRNTKERARVNQKLFFNNSILFPHIRNAIYAAVYEGMNRLSEKLRNSIEESYEFLEEFLARSNYLAGDNMTIADLAAVASVSTLVHILPLEPGLYPKIEEWLKLMEEKPFYQKYNAPGAEKIGQWIRGMIS